MRRTIIALPLIALLLGILAARALRPVRQVVADTSVQHLPHQLVAAVQSPRTPAEKIVAGALEQAREGALYTPGYFNIPYPNGDLPRHQGVCTDVVVRALRQAGYDLQKLVHEDMKRNFSQYPQLWGLKKPDPNIDHRRVPNLMCFFQRHGKSLTLEVSQKTLKDWQPGDIVCWRLDNGLYHCGILSSARNANGVPLVVHNISQCTEEDCLTGWKIIGHYRYPKDKRDKR